MNAFAHFTALADDLHARPLFYVQSPDGKRDWSEAARQTVMFRELRDYRGVLDGFHIPNAGIRNPMKALAAGIKAGPFDTEWAWWHGGCAWVELKGYDKRGTAGKLSEEQIRWGNKRHAMGFDVACFFDPYDAIDWLRGLGAPIPAAVRR